MKKAITAIVCVLLFSCTKYTQLYQTKPTTSGIKSDKLYYFENDTLKITYSFWEKNGTLAYSIYNKLSTPIYIDWKKSSFISNGVKHDYWVDETITHSSSYRVGSSSLSYGYYGLLGLSTTSTAGTSRSLKPERIIFIAPHSNTVSAKFSLYSSDAQKLKPGAKSSSLNISNSNKATPITYVEFDESDSPLTFRNFLSISTTENFQKEEYIDNGFYVSRISQIKMSDFLGSAHYDDKMGKTIYQMPFKGPSLFYLDVK